ncbi:MAG TPA: hypothetical protein VEL74_19990 [Thermoanaerobaculia bacterium]|nr:hypothetical protein [Thermoanaerobaculia bacterium]
MRSDQPLRIEVEVEVAHRGSAPLHLNRNKRHGRAVVAADADGVKMIEQRWLGRSWLASLWKDKPDDDEPMLDELEAENLVDPVGMIDLLLTDATLVSDEAATWQDQPARLLVIRPGLPVGEREEEAPAPSADVESEPGPLTLDAKIWLDENGVPLALERSMELGLGVVKATGDESFTFQQSEGRLLVSSAELSSTGQALAVLRSRDDKKLKVTGIR